MAATNGISGTGFVPPYFFAHLKKADPRNANDWEKCRQQAKIAFERRAQESQHPTRATLTGYAAPLSVSQLPSVKVVSLSSSRATYSAPLSTSRVTVYPKKQDTDVTYAQSHGNTVMRFLSEKLNRSSFDDRGSELKIYVHDKGSQNNAYWRDNAVYIGDSTLPGRQSLTEDIDITAHEVGHGVDQYSSRFVYQGQSGALAESWADVFGSMVKQYNLEQTSASADWLIGDQYVDDLPGQIEALRSMKEPGEAYRFSRTNKDPQIDHMEKIPEVDLTQFDDQDHGGVHIFSGIPNKAFYEFAMGFPRRYSYELAGKVWYQALCSSVNREATFQEFAEATVKAIEEVKGLPPRVSVNDIAERLEKAWESVGIQVKKAPVKEPVAPMMPVPSVKRFSPAPTNLILDERGERGHRRRRYRTDEGCDCTLV